MPQEQRLNLEEKVEIIPSYLEGAISKSEAARRGGVAWDTIEQRVRNYGPDGAEAFLLHKKRPATLGCWPGKIFISFHCPFDGQHIIVTLRLPYHGLSNLDMAV